MAPPIPGLRQPVHVPHRTAGDVLVGLAAVVALAALTVGVPIALVGVIGLPWPHGTVGVSVLTHQLGIPSILRVLSIVLWLAWLQLVWCVIVEIRAAVRNSGVPSRVPLAGATQSAAHRLVTAALLLFTAASALSPGPGPRRPAPAGPHDLLGRAGRARRPAGHGPGRPAAAGPGAERGPAPQADKIYVVKPPDGRYHESLWEIAQNHLGDGRRYAEIYELNKDRVQAGRQQADHRQPDPARLGAAHAAGRERSWHRGRHQPGPRAPGPRPGQHGWARLERGRRGRRFRIGRLHRNRDRGAGRHWQPRRHRRSGHG